MFYNTFSNTRIFWVLLVLFGCLVLPTSCNEDDYPSTVVEDPDPTLATFQDQLDSKEKPINPELVHPPKVVNTKKTTTQGQGTVTTCTTTIMEAGAENDLFPLFSQTSDILYHYSLLDVQSLVEGGFTPILGGKYAKQRIVFQGPVVDGPVSFELDPSLSNYAEILNNFKSQPLLDPTELQAAQFDVIDVYSEEQLEHSLKARVGLKIPFLGKIKGSIDWKKIEEGRGSYFVVELVQKTFTADADLPKLPEDLFEEYPDLSNTSKVSPVFISTITYGRAAYFVFSSNYSREETKLALNASFNILKIVKGNGSIDKKHENILNSLSISALILGGSQGPAFEAINGVEGIKKYIKDGFSTDHSFGVPLSFKVRFLKDFSIARTVSNLTYPVRQCKEIKLPKEKEVNFSILDMPSKIAVHTGGDREFGGIAEIDVEAKLMLNHSKTKIDLEVVACFKEPRPDYTEGKIVWERSGVYKAPPGYFIEEIFLKNKNGKLKKLRKDKFHTVDKDTSLDLFSPNGPLLKELLLNGDTGGTDLPNTGKEKGDIYNEASVHYIKFNNVTVKIKEKQ